MEVEIEGNEPGQPIPKNGGKLSLEEESYRRKYLALKRKCGSVESDNKKMLNRIYQVRKAISRLSRERRGLIKKLSDLKDTFKAVERTTPLEDLPLMYLLGFADQSGQGPKVSVKPAIDPRTGFPILSKAKVNSKSVLAREKNMSSSTPRKRKAKDGIKIDKEKDPKAPKKPANAFLMFCQEKRHIANHPIDPDKSKLESHADLTRQLAKQWNDLDKAQKKRYFAAYEKKRLKYVEKVQQYSKNLEGETSKSAAIPSSATNPSTPSKAPATKKEPAEVLGKKPPDNQYSAKITPPVKVPTGVKAVPTGMESIRAVLESRAGPQPANEVDPYSFDGE